MEKAEKTKESDERNKEKSGAAPKTLTKYLLITMYLCCFVWKCQFIIRINTTKQKSYLIILFIIGYRHRVKKIMYHRKDIEHKYINTIEKFFG